MYMNVFLAYMSVHYVRAWCPQRLEEGVESPETEVIDIMWVLGSFQEH